MTALNDWFDTWGVPREARTHLIAILTASDPMTGKRKAPATEADVQALARMAIQASGGIAWRNQVGVLPNPAGQPVRFGLANDSKQMNETVKSADLIGCLPRLITEEMVGETIGQFWSRECKAPGWTYRGTGREPAQLAWANLILSLGGDAGFQA